MNRLISPLTPRRRATLLFFGTVLVLFGSLFATARAQSVPPESVTPDTVSLTLTAATTSGVANVAYLGERITYTLRLTNTGNTTLNNILLIDDLPRDTLNDYQCTGCEYQTESQTFPDPLGGTITVTVTRRISWTIATLAPGQSIVRSFSARVVGQPDGAEFTNRAFAYYLVNGIPTTVNSNDNVVTSRVQLAQDGTITLSSAATWFSDDFGGTLSQDWGDFDRDGDLDLLLGSSIATTIYRNDEGDLNRYWSTERTAYGVRWLDIGADNFSFVAVGASVDGTAVTTGTNVIYTYNPNATNAATRFLEVDTFLSDLQLIRVQPGDINKDGWVDLIGTTNAINADCPTQIFLHSGDPATPYTDYRTACASNDASAAIALGDADNDGDLDLASGRFASQDATLLFNTFEPTQVLTDVIFTDTNSVAIEDGLSFLPYDFSWGDFDNDGLLDLAAAYPLEREARVYRNLGGNFDDPIVIRTSVFRTPLSVDWGDFNNDGVLELAVAGATPRIYRIFEDGTTQQLAALGTNAIPIGTQIWSIRGIDQDNDNDLDLSLASRDGPSQIFTMFAPFLTTTMTIVDSTSSSSAAWGDADGDGTQDLLLGAGPPSTTGFGTRLYYNQGGRFQPNQSDQITGFGPHIVAFGDVNKDGRLDIALGTTAQTQIYLADQLTSPAWTSPNANVNNALAWGDLDHDGDLDLLVGSSQASLIYRKKGNLLENTPIWVSNHADDTRSVAWVDFDGDQLLDFVLGNNGQPNRLYRNIERNRFEEVQWNPQIHATRALAWADYDGDGDPDLAVADYNGSVLIYENLSKDEIEPQFTLKNTPIILPASNHRPTALAWGDWDNDGDPDLAVGHDGFNIQVYSNQTRNPETPSFAWVWASELSYNTTSVAWGDFDNDGDLDLAASQNGNTGNGLFVNGYITPAHLRNFETTIPLPDNSSYVHIERPGQTDEAFFYSSPDILSGPVQPSVPIRYRVYDPDGSRDPTVPNPAGDNIVRTFFEYSLDGGGTWETATPSPETTPITMTSRLGVEGLFIWNAQADQAISDNTLFRVRVVPVTSRGTRPRGAAVGISAPFRVRGTTCEWPLDATMTISPTNPMPGDLVRFTGAIAAGTGVITYRWNFGDGTSAQGQTVSHTYVRDDIFNVLLTVSGPPCPINYPAYAETTLTIGDPIIGPDTFLPLIGRGPATTEPDAITDETEWEGETTRIPPSPFRPTLPIIKPGNATQNLPNVCLAPSQVSNTPIGISNQPVISNDGSHIAFWSTGDLAPISGTNNLDGNIEIFLWQRNGTTPTFLQVTDSPGTILGGLNIAPSINGAGNRIAFFSDRNLSGSNPDGTFEVFVAAVGNNGAVTIVQVTDEDRTSSILPSISADGRRVAYISDELGSPNVYIANLNADGTVNGPPVPVTNFPNVATDQPVISSNGGAIAFISTANISNGNPDGNGEIFVARSTNGTNWTIQQVTFTEAGIFNEEPDLNGDGSRLTFVSTGTFSGLNPQGNSEVFSATVGTSVTLTALTSTTLGVNHTHPSLSDDGLRIAFVSNADSNGNPTSFDRVFLYDGILGEYGEVSNQSSANNSVPFLSRTGDRISYVSNSGGNREVYRLDCFVADVAINSTVNPNPAVPGAPLTYIFTVNNLGPNDAITTTVTATISSEITNIATTPSSCTVDTSTNQIVCGIGTVAANQSRVVRINGTLDGEARDILVADGTVGSETFDRNPSNDATTMQTPVQPELSLVLTVTDSPDPVVAGTPLTYTLRVVNQGPSTATDIEVRDTFPTAYPSPALVSGNGCQLVGQQLSCDYASLLPGEFEVITVTGVVDGFTRNTLSNSATVESNEYPLDTSTETTDIIATVDLTATALVQPDPVQAGETVTFTIALTNAGPSGATGIVAQTIVPTDVTGLVVTPAASCPAPTTNTVTCTFPTLNPNSTRTYTITGIVDPAARNNRTLATTISTNEQPLPLLINKPYTIAATVNLDLRLDSNPPTPIAGSPLTYTFTVENNGPATANNLFVTDTYATNFDVTAIDPDCQTVGVQSVLCRISTLDPNASESFTLIGTIDSSTSGILSNTVSVTAEEVPIPVTVSLTPTVNANVTLLVTPTIQPDPLVAGDAVTYTLNVVNLGPSNATNVVLTGTVTDLFSETVTGACTLNNEEYECNFGTLEPNDPVTVVASGVISPTARGTLENNAVLTADELSAPQIIPLNEDITVEANLLFNLTANPAGDVIAGQPIEYTLSAINTGRSTALDITFSDTFEYLLTPSASPGCTLDNNTFTCELPDGIGPNQTELITVTGTVSPSAPSPLDNIGTLIWGETGDVFTDSITSNVLADIDFDIVLSPPGTTAVIAGEALTYTVAVTNTGDSVAPNVAVTGTLSNLTGATVTIVGGSSCPITSGVYTCTLGTLSPQVGNGRVRINGTVSPTYRGTLTNTVTISAEVSPTVSVNRLFSNPVQDDVVLDIDTSVSPTTPNAGQTVNYTFGITNTGDSTALNVVLADTLTKVLTPTISFVTTQGGCTVNDFIVTCNLGALPKNTPTSVTISATVDPAARSNINNNYAVSSPDITTVSGALNRPLNANTTLNLDVTAAGTITAGLPISYVVNLTNNGPSTATSTGLSATLTDLISITENSTACSISLGNVLDCNIGTMTVGQLFTVQVNGVVSPTTQTTINNVFNADALESSPATDSVSTAIIRDVDLAISMASLPNTTVLAGQDLLYTVTVTNTGASAALDTVITATTLSLLTPTLTITPTGDCSLNPTLLIVCDADVILPNTVYTVTYSGQLDPSKRGNLTNSTGVTEIGITNPITANKTVMVNAQADLQVTVHPSTPVVAGRPLTYTITLINNGPSTANSVDLTGTLNVLQSPTGTFGGFATCVITSSFACDAPALLPDVPYTVTIAGDIPGTRRNNIINNFRATSFEDNSLLNTVNSGVTADVELATNIRVTGLVTASAPITFTAFFTNSGDSTALTSTLTYTYSHFAAAPSHTITGVTGSCTPNHPLQRVVCTFGNTLTGNDSGSVRFVGTLAATLPPTITHSAEIRSQNPTDIDADSIEVTTGQSYPLSLNITAAGVITSGEILTYTVLVANDSDIVVSGITLTDTYANFSAAPTVINPPGGSCSVNHANQRVVCTFASIPAQSQQLVTIVGTLGAGLPPTVTNNATVRSTTPPFLINDSLSLQRNTSIPMRFNITATGTVTHSAPITYTFHVTNTGAITVNTVVITDSYERFTAAPTATVISGPPGNCTVNHPQEEVVCTFNNFPPQTSAKITIRGTWVASGLPSSVTNSADLQSINPTMSVSDSLTLTRNQTYPLAFGGIPASPWAILVPLSQHPFRKRKKGR
jgi:uncharacterized repeat protein (TIGR01451 family)